MQDFFSSHRLGLFIHWGIYAVGGWHEQEMGRRCIPRETYAQYANSFYPVQYDPDDWVKRAKAAGMSYICITAKHHDGFCMWDTAETDYKVTNTPYGKDILKMLSDACARHGMDFSIYYSNPDWHHPNAYNANSSHQLLPEVGDVPDLERYKEYIKRQLKELLTGYGKISTFFWDIPPQAYDPSLNDLIRSLQPDILINDRGWSQGDYGTPERGVPDGRQFHQATEACQSISRISWGYRREDDFYTPACLLRYIDSTLSKGGTYLLNIGPTPEGTLGSRGEAILTALSKWYTKVQPSFGIPCIPPEYPENQLLGDLPEVLFTRRENTLYLHFPKALEHTGVIFPTIQNVPTRAFVLNDGTAVAFGIRQIPSLCGIGTGGSNGLYLWDIPAERYTQETPVIALEFEKDSFPF